MYDNPPSRAQLRYLKNLGYGDQLAPQSMAEASAAIDEMLLTGDPARAALEILVERRERKMLFGQFEAGSSRRARQGSLLWLMTAPFVAFGHIAAALFWILSRLIALVGWLALGIAAVIVWVLSRVGLLAMKSAAAASQAGREKVIPWIGAQDWRRMARGCGAQLRAGMHRVDGLLGGASGDDRALHHILRFATVATAAFAVFGGLLFLFK